MTQKGHFPKKAYVHSGSPKKKEFFFLPEKLLQNYDSLFFQFHLFSALRIEIKRKNSKKNGFSVF